MSTVRLPLWVWLSMVRMGSAFSLCESVVAVQDLFALPVWESDVCAQSVRLEQKYTPIASSMSRLKRAARNGRGRPSLHRRSTRADLPCPSRSEIFVVGIDSHPACRVRPRRTLQVPLRIALRQTVSASTPHDVPLP